MPARRRRRFAAVLAAALLAASVSCTAPDPAGSGSPATEQLDRLTVVERPAADRSYRRSAFGPAWADVDGDGCNTRDQVLYAARDPSAPVRVRRQGRCPVDVVAGTWADFYTGRSLVFADLKDPRQAERLTLDHVVSLSGAWRYGASAWSGRERLRFANDPLNLVPSAVEVNQDKGDLGPADWTPPEPGRCGYATRYVEVKARYGLPVDPREKAALARLLDACPG